ncbi:VOC family protein [Lactococcus cremoris]|uniref:VOC family protein n=1 Tax=Lactococcus lactis subsp. cremoris TaxID=1359 RepID=UPI0021AA96B9|nr:VOC family protein [Lactococcus cremoris]MCT4415242.1 VOC family protein [Lactococcus cremoris]
MIDHLDIHVQYLSRTKFFYTAVLATLGGSLIDESKTSLTYQTGETTDGYIWFEEGEPYSFHFAFQVKTKAEVDQFYKIALENGGKDNGRPGNRPSDQKYYYAAFIIDPDGYRIEAVCHTGKE